MGPLALLACIAGAPLNGSNPPVETRPSSTAAQSGEAPQSPSSLPPATSGAPAGVATPPAAPPELKIEQHPLPFDAERARLTLAYRRQHQGYTGTEITIQPTVVVLHWTGGSTALSAWNTFAPTRAADARPELAAAGEVNVSSQFIVDRDGTIWQLMPENQMARHCIGLNHLAIGIENVGAADLGGDSSKSPLTPAQVQADVALIRDLRSRWPLERVIGHLEYRRLEGTSYFLELDPNYRTGKADPGPNFTAAVRAGLADLGLTGP